jgi:glycosyltransferase involved in cell wall biosynthesis
MKLLVISHACVTPINQSFYVDVAETTGWDIELVVPELWETEYKAGVKTERWPAFTGKLRTIPVLKSGNIPLHVYRSAMVGLLKRARPDAIYMHHEPYGAATMQVYMANRMAGNAPIGFYAAQNILKKYPLPFRWFERYVFGHSGFAFPVAPGALQVLREKGYKARAEVLPLPIDLEIYRHRPEWAAEKRRELGIGADEFVIGYLGRLVEEKGLASLFRACAMLKGNWRCVLVGSGGFEPELRGLANELGIAGRIVFEGFVPHQEAPGWFSLFDLFALPSETRPHWKEQFGRVIVEANACGTAVVGTESGEIGNVIRSTAGGVTVPEANAPALAAAIQCMLDDPTRRLAMAASGASAARTIYDQQHLARRFAGTIEAAVAEARTKGSGG